MSNSEIVESLEDAKAYLKANKKFFRKFFFYFRIVNNPIVKFISKLFAVLALGSIVVGVLSLFEVIGSSQGEYVGIAFIVLFISIIVGLSDTFLASSIALFMAS